jgi:hypothetical protein
MNFQVSLCTEAKGEAMQCKPVAAAHTGAADSGPADCTGGWLKWATGGGAQGGVLWRFGGGAGPVVVCTEGILRQGVAAADTGPADCAGGRTGCAGVCLPPSEQT